VRLGMLPESEAARIAEVIKQAGLPAVMPDFNDEDKEKVLEALKHDKKVRNDHVRFILLQAIGHAVVSDTVSPELIKEVLFGRGKT
jgi:3-dehydroquinate synthase